MASDNDSKRRAFSIFAVVLILATAFAGASFIGSAITDEDSSAGGGSSSSPLDSLSDTASMVDGTYYVKVGGSVSVTPDPQGGGIHVTSVTSGYGLSLTSSAGAKTLSGTISKAGTITCSLKSFSGTTDYGTFTIVAVSSGYTYTLIYNDNGGSGGPGTVTATDTSTQHQFTISSTKPTKAGYTFKGWSLTQYSAGSGTAQYGTDSGLTGTIRNSASSSPSRTLYAVWESSGYTVTFNGNGGTPGSSSLSGSTITLPGASRSSTTGSTQGSTSTYTYYTVTSYSFDGWYTSASGGTYKGGSGSSFTPTGNTTLYAHWSSSTSTYYTYYFKVSYDANGGSGAPSTTDGGTSSSSTKSVTLSSTIPTRSGYTFLGWSTSSGAISASYSPGSSYSFSYGTTTLYAVWQQNTTTYYAKLAYDANGGSGAPSQQSTSGNYTSNPGSHTFTISSTTPTRSGYSFLGWSTSSTASSPSYYAGGSISVNYSTSSTAKVTLYAVWQQNTLSFTSANGTDAIVTGNTFSYTPTFNTSGVSVSVSGASWLSVSNGTVTGTPSTPGTYNVTLTATKTNWTSATQSFTITIAERLGFTSEPSGNIAVTEA